MSATLNEINKFIKVKRNNEGVATELSKIKASVIQDKHGRIVDEFGPEGTLSFSPEGWLLYRNKPVALKPNPIDIGNYEFNGDSLIHTADLSSANIVSSNDINFITGGSVESVSISDKALIINRDADLSANIEFPTDEPLTIRLDNTSSNIVGVSDVINFSGVSYITTDNVSDTEKTRLLNFGNVFDYVCGVINTDITAIDTTGSTLPFATGDITVAKVGTDIAEITFGASVPDVLSGRVQISTRDPNYSIAISSVTTTVITVQFINITSTEAEPNCAFNILVLFDTTNPNPIA